jgi:streptolysin S family bacteriocin protoxin
VRQRCFQKAKPLFLKSVAETNAKGDRLGFRCCCCCCCFRFAVRPAEAGEGDQNLARPSSSPLKVIRITAVLVGLWVAGGWLVCVGADESSWQQQKELHFPTSVQAVQEEASFATL